MDYFLGAAAHRSASQPLENCLRAVRHGPHFVQSTKPQFSEVVAFQESKRCAGTVNRGSTYEKTRFPACGKCRPCRMAGKRFFRCPDSIRTLGLMPLPFPQALKKGLDPKLLIFARFFVTLTPAPILTLPPNLFFDSLTLYGRTSHSLMATFKSNI